VIAWQKSFVMSGSISSAAGRYQITRGTLKDLKRKMGLDGTELFDEAMQDRMALALLNRRGMGEYLLGTMTEADFINRIAMEWAGLPNMTGRSHYDGDGVNSAKVPLTRVQTVVSTLR